MSIPISSAAALGVANLATGAVSQTVQGSVEVASHFAEVLGETLSESAGELAAPRSEIASEKDTEIQQAKSSLKKLLGEWMRHFGLAENEPIEVSHTPGSDWVRIESATASPQASRKLLDLQTRINSDDSLRSQITDSLSRLPGARFSRST